jgi:GntR family transcriptional regulator
MEKRQPAYRVLADLLREAIVAGRYPPHRRLPTEVELAAEHGVSRQTVRHAFAELVAESRVYRVRGRGTYATPIASGDSFLRSSASIDELLALPGDAVLELVRPFERKTDISAAGRLRLSSDDVLVGIFRYRRDGLALCVNTIYLPPELGPAIEADRTVSRPGPHRRLEIIELIERHRGHPVVGAHQSITAVGIPPEIAELLESEPDAPALRIDRLYYDRVGKLVELAISHFDPSRYSYRVELRRSFG